MGYLKTAADIFKLHKYKKELYELEGFGEKSINNLIKSIEISKNIDAYRISTFMHKDKNQKLKMGPIWDFNLGFGNVNYCDAEITSGWSYKFNDVCGGDNWKVPFWWNRLFEDPAFVSKLKNS